LKAEYWIGRCREFLKRTRTKNNIHITHCTHIILYLLVGMRYIRLWARGTRRVIYIYNAIVFYGVQTLFVSFLFLRVFILFYYCCFVFHFCFPTMTNRFQNVCIIDFRTPVPRRSTNDEGEQLTHVYHMHYIIIYNIMYNNNSL